ncbi:MAG: hypothetical protein ABSA23_03420 [Anaerolineales bacterium]|jgi:hypothetical protein
MKHAYYKVLFILILLSLAMPQRTVQAYAPSGGVNVFTTLPELICVGDSLTLEGAAGVDYPPIEPSGPGLAPLAPLVENAVQITAMHGKVSPSTITHIGDFNYFSFTYTATSAGDDEIKLNLNNGLATYEEKFTVQKSCDYDAFLVTYMNFSTQAGDYQFRSFTTTTGMGTMKRLRTGELYFQGTGNWDLDEDILSKPPECVQWYTPPLIANGPFDLDGKLSEEGDAVDVILQFLPSGEPIFHGISTCTHADGSVGAGWSQAMDGNPDLAAKIQTTFPSEGGTQQVEMTGKGLSMVQSMGDLEYTAQLTLVPR